MYEKMKRIQKLTKITRQNDKRQRSRRVVWSWLDSRRCAGNSLSVQRNVLTVNPKHDDRLIVNVSFMLNFGLIEE